MAESLAQLRRSYSWDKNSLRWRGPSGRYIKESRLKADLVRYAERTGEEIRSLARQMSTGELAIGEWQEATARQLKNLHVAMSAAGRGGFERLTQTDYGRLGARLRYQYRRLAEFAADVQAGRLSPARIVARADLYAASGNGTYERANNDNWRELAATGTRVQMRNVLGIAEHCHAQFGVPGCYEETGRGWVALGEMSLPGERRCAVRCKCRMKYRRRK